MTQTIPWPCGRTEFNTADYWHLNKDISGEFNLLLHNIKTGLGVVASASFVRVNAGIDGATTPYAMCNSEQDKEGFFEKARACDFPSLPTRSGAFFLFHSEQDANRAHQKWFPSESRKLLRAWIASDAKTHVADTEYLSGRQEEWRDNAEHYWKGDQTLNPLLEVIVEGYIYFPDWEQL
jgi:hypothetical protein